MSNAMRSNRILSAVCLTMGICACNDGGYQIVQSPDRFVVEREDLRIIVREQAEIQAAVSTSVKSQLDGRENTLIYLIPEGSVVTKGQRLAEIDVSEIQEKRANQAIAVAKAGAILEQARKNFEILERELDAASAAADSRLTIATMELEKFMGKEIEHPAANGVASIDGTNLAMLRKLEEMLATATSAEDGGTAEVRFSGLPDKVREILADESGEAVGRDMGQMANQILQQIDQIRLARAQLTVDLDTRDHSRSLAERKFITSNELEKDELTYESQLSKVTLAWNDVDLLINYTLVQDKIRKRQDVLNEQLTKTMVEASNGARRVKEEADLDSNEAEYKLATERLVNWDRQIENAVILAPTDGLVVYAKQGRGVSRQPVEEGMNVHKRQSLIILPDVTNMIAELKVHEADIDKVAPTQAATIRVDAFPERVYRGRITRVSALPDSGSRWSNNDLKVYKTSIAFDEENTEGTLRPGMNATVEIMVGVAEDVLTVPLPAVLREGTVQYVWKQATSGPVAQVVRVGRNNLTHVEVVDGLLEGETIFLAPPPGAEMPKFGQAENAGDAVFSSAAVPRTDAAMFRQQQQRQQVTALLGNPTEFLGRLREFLLVELPNYGDELEDENNWMRLLSNPAFQDEVDMVLGTDPTLLEAWQIFKDNGGQLSAPRGGNRPGGRGGPGGRGRGRDGPGRGGNGRR